MSKMSGAKASEARAPGDLAIPTFTFAHNTMESVKNDLESREARRKARQDSAMDLQVSSRGSLKRNAATAEISSNVPNKKLLTSSSSQFEVPNTNTNSLSVMNHDGRPIVNKGGRPRKHPVVKVQTGPTRLSSRNPVKNRPNADVWFHIFKLTSPSFLLRMHNNEGDSGPLSILFKDILKVNSVWKEARYTEYGYNHPDPPPNMTEVQYADLLSGVGCQSKGCEDTNARTVLWAFLQRWCAKCVINNTVEDGVASRYNATYPLFGKCVMRATFDAWSRYSYAGDAPLANAPDYVHIQNRVDVRYMRSSLSALIIDIEALPHLTPEEQSTWWEVKADNANQALEKIQAIEKFQYLNKNNKSQTAKSTRGEREAYFREMAAQLDDPLYARALNMMPKYHSAVAIPKLPSERSWKKFTAKAEEARKETKVFEDSETKCLYNPSIGAEKRRTYENLRTLRRDSETPIQQAIKAAGARAIVRYQARIQQGLIADSDILPLLLRATYEEFDSNEALYYSHGQDCSLILTFDDAKEVVESTFAPFLKELNKTSVLRSLKCPGCKRKDSNKLYEFPFLMRHIYQKHAPLVGDFRYFRVPTAYVPPMVTFPGLYFKWPKNLPVLAKHHVATGKWDPEDVSDYQLETVHMPRVYSNTAFNGRSVSLNGPDPKEFVDNCLFVCKLYNDIRLDAKFKTQIALKFASEKYQLAFPNDLLEIAVLDNLQLALVKDGCKNVFEKFQCLACSLDEERPRRNNKFANRPQSFMKLKEHFLASHGTSNWAANMFKLPHEGELWEVLNLPENESSLNLFDALFPVGD